MNHNLLKKNILFQYSILTLILILSVAILMGNLITKHSTESLINAHVELYPDALALVVKENDEVCKMLRDNVITYNSNEIPSYLIDFLTIGQVFRIKIWSSEGTILWSDESTIIGKNFGSNIYFRQALSKEVFYTLEEPSTIENKSEQNNGKVLEIYIPIQEHGEVIGVIELYEKYDALEKEVQEVEYSIFLTVFLFGFILYWLQFFIFYNAYRRLREINYQLDKTKEVTLFALATLAETRDNETGGHLQRTSEYVRIIAEELRKLPAYTSYFTKAYIRDLVLSAKLHDIGKVGIKDSILLKKGKLTLEEFEEMKTHSIIGANTLKSAEKKLEFRSFLTIAKQITLYHHEKWNGRGYPEGLVGETIPISARIMAIADVYDALRSQRPYKGITSHSDAKKIIVSESGEHFDPVVVEMFLKIEHLFEEISNESLEMDYLSK